MKMATSVALFFGILSVSIGNAVSQQYSFKCATTIYMCGGLQQNNVCNNPGTDSYETATSQQCEGLIAATKKSGTFSYKCPNNRAISHYVSYDCSGVGTKYEGAGPQTCSTCPAGKCGLPCGGGAVGGDPHFKTYDGTLYSFHGECDLVMAHSAEFGNGMGLNVHARTKIIDHWSLVSSAAVKVGDDVFEVENDDTYYVNGQPGAGFPFAFGNGQYQVTKNEESVEMEGQDEQGVVRTWYNVDLNNGHFIKISNFKSMISVNVDVPLNDSYGMLGTSAKAGLIGRDGEHVGDDHNEMGLQWQVTDTEPMLFRDARMPQYPERCILPAVGSRRRLRSADSGTYGRALKACAGVADDTLRSFCFDDVMMTGDASAAATYGAVF